MGKALWCAVLWGALLASNAAAQPYVGIGGGGGKVDLGCTHADCDQEGPALKALVGYEFASGWAVEAGYINFESGDVFFEEFESRLAILNAAYRHKLGASNWGVLARIGAAYVTTEHEVWLGTDSTTRGEVVSPYGGVGFTYGGRHVMFELAADFSRGKLADRKGNIAVVTAGVRFSF